MPVACAEGPQYRQFEAPLVVRRFDRREQHDDAGQQRKTEHHADRRGELIHQRTELPHHGIYIDCGLRGKFDESGRDSISIGTIKTLSTDLDACKIMGELCGVLMYHESKYVNEHLTLFDSSESIERMLTKPLLLEQTQAEALQMSGQQM